MLINNIFPIPRFGKITNNSDYFLPESFIGVIIDKYRDKWWYENKNLHRIGGPAIEKYDGTKAWYINGSHHRLDGPVIEYSDGTNKWFLHGKKYSEKDYWKRIEQLRNQNEKY